MFLGVIGTVSKSHVLAFVVRSVTSDGIIKSPTTHNKNKNNPSMSTVNERAELYRKKYQLANHPEGGYYTVTYNAPHRYPFAPPKIGAPASNSTIPNERPISTGIYYMLTNGDFSAFHRIDSDEMWHYYDGNVDVIVHELNPGNKQQPYTRHVLGKVSDDAHFQCVIPAGSWFAAELLSNSSDGGDSNDDGSGGQIEHFALCGCTVSPGFMFESFEMAKRDELLSSLALDINNEGDDGTDKFLVSLITRLTRQ